MLGFVLINYLQIIAFGYKIDELNILQENSFNRVGNAAAFSSEGINASEINMIQTIDHFYQVAFNHKSMNASERNFIETSKKVRINEMTSVQIEQLSKFTSHDTISSSDRSRAMSTWVKVSLDLALITDQNERDSEWAGWYFSQFGKLPNSVWQSTLDAFWDDYKTSQEKWQQFIEEMNADELFKTWVLDYGQVDAENLYIQLVEYNLAFNVVSTFLSSNLTQKTDADIKVIRGGIGMFVNKAIEKAARSAFVKGVQKAAIEGGMKPLVQKTIGAIFIKAAGTSSIAFGTPVGVATFVGFFLGEGIAYVFGISEANGRVIEGLNVVGTVGFGAAVGAMAAAGSVGGPAGAVAGATTGAVGYAVYQVIASLFRIGKGPADNWVYYSVDSSCGNFNFFCYTYAESDRLEAIAYNRHTWLQNKTNVISAGQAQDRMFKLKWYYKKTSDWSWTASTYLETEFVAYRDQISISCQHGRIDLFHGKGEFNKHGGTTDLKDIKPY